MSEPDFSHDSPEAHRPWYELGEEPDYRFSLANERTFLAWIRTALALMAASVGVTVVRPRTGGHAPLTAMALILTLLALVISVLAYSQWAAKQKAMRLDQPLPRPRLLVPVCVTSAAVAVLLLAILPAL